MQTGDILDRGSDARKIFDLLMRLEKEAAAAGGMVHVLLGNHEEMTLTGIVFDYPDYVTVGQFVSFLPPSYRSKKEKELRKSPDGSSGERVRDFWQAVMKTATGRRQYIEGFHALYGAWLLRKNAVIRINDTIFVHGGISEKYSSWKIETINALLRKELGIFVERHRMFPTGRLPFVPRIVYDPSGPLWFREHALQEDEAIRGEFDRVMKNLGARHMVIAHTFYRGDGLSPLVAPAYMSRFDGRLWIIDTGISEAFGGVNSALIIDAGAFGLWTDAGEIEAAPAPAAGKTPAADAPEAGEEYLKTARIDSVVRGTERGRTEPWTIVLDGADERPKGRLPLCGPAPAFPASGQLAIRDGRLRARSSSSGWGSFPRPSNARSPAWRAPCRPTSKDRCPRRTGVARISGRPTRERSRSGSPRSAPSPCW